jgi:hypothetical protein
MKWKKKFITCALLAGLTTLILSAGANLPSVNLVATKKLSFPSASGIEYYKDKLYLFGDNATHLLILSTDYSQSDSVDYWSGDEPVIDKSDKPDIESAMIVTKDQHPVLFGVGSMSDKKRWQVFEFSLSDLTFRKTHFFDRKDVFPGIEDVNIEGSAQVDNTVVLCNRANEKTKRNHLLFWNWKDSVTAKEIDLPETNVTAGMSGLYYVKDKDILLFTASEEATNNAVKDGEIGDSYLGWINDFSEKMMRAKLTPDGFLKLSSFDKAFARQKVESVCAERVSGDRYLLHLVSDNDNNESRIFKIELKL